MSENRTSSTSSSIPKPQEHHDLAISFRLSTSAASWRSQTVAYGNPKLLHSYTLVFPVLSMICTYKTITIKLISVLAFSLTGSTVKEAKALIFTVFAAIKFFSKRPNHRCYSRRCNNKIYHFRNSFSLTRKHSKPTCRIGRPAPT